MVQMSASVVDWFLSTESVLGFTISVKHRGCQIHFEANSFSFDEPCLAWPRENHAKSAKLTQTNVRILKDMAKKLIKLVLLARKLVEAMFHLGQGLDKAGRAHNGESRAASPSSSGESNFGTKLVCSGLFLEQRYWRHNGTN